MDPGGGEYNEATGLRVWYFPQAQKEVAAASEHTWLAVLGVWSAIELDLHERYQVDVESDVLDHRSWRWLALRIGGVVSTEGTRTFNALTYGKVAAA